MTIRVYLMPTVVRGGTDQFALSKRAKYRELLSNSAQIHYGPEPYCIVVSDVNATEHANVTANSDVRTLPQDLDTTIAAGVRTTIVNTLEAAGIPAQWVATGMTFRAFLRRLNGIFAIAQGVHGKKFRLLLSALEDPISSLPAAARQALLDIAAREQLSTAGITGASTLRAALTVLCSQFDSRPVQYGGVSL